MSNTQQAVNPFRCRKVEPEETAFIDVSAATPEDAANIYHLKERGGVHLSGTDEWYAVIHVEGHGQYISKIHLDGIGREGGLKSPNHHSAANTLADVATTLKVPECDLLEDDWIGASNEWYSLQAV